MKKKPNTRLGIEENAAGALCYFLWWGTGLFFLVYEKDNKFIKFHALQSIYSSIVWSGIVFLIKLIFPKIAYTAYVFLPMSAIAFGMWLFLMAQAAQNKMFKLPVIGYLAESNSLG